MKKKPMDLKEHPKSNISNYDNTIDSGLSQVLKNSKYYAQHAAWDFWGYVWWENATFFEEVWVYGSHKETFSAKSLKKLMETVNDKYGWN